MIYRAEIEYHNTAGEECTICLDFESDTLFSCCDACTEHEISERFTDMINDEIPEFRICIDLSDIDRPGFLVGNVGVMH